MEAETLAEPCLRPEEVSGSNEEENDQNHGEEDHRSVQGEESPETGLSKNQQKRIKKLERKLERRKELRILEKQRKKEKRKVLKEQGLGGILKRKKHTTMADSACKQKVVVDMAYEHLMNSNLIRNTIAQLTFSYSANRKMPNPSQYHITGVTGQTKKLFNELEGTKGWDVNIHEEPLERVFDSSEIVYLTSDSSNTLEKLNESDVYVIGGLLDHNRYPEASLKRAEANNWRHAKLPIGEFVKINSRKVLTINQVFEILLQYMEHNNWEKAFFNVIPKRKGVEKINQTDADRLKSEVEAHNDRKEASPCINEQEKEQ